MFIYYCMVFIINTDLNIYTWKIILVSRYSSRIWENEFQLEVAIRTGYLQQWTCSIVKFKGRYNDEPFFGNNGMR